MADTTAPTRRAGTATKRMMFFAGGAHPALGSAIAAELGVPIAPWTEHAFANGERFVRFGSSVRGCDAFVLHTPAPPMNAWLMDQLVTLDALKRASARRVTAVLPFYPYSRQDKKHRGREPISARLVADLLTAAGADRIITVDLHTPQTHGFFNGPVDHLRAQPLLAADLLRCHRDREFAVVAPDAGRVRLAETWADLLGGAPIAFVRRRETLASEPGPGRLVVGDVAGQVCVVVDDMIDTGATMAGAARLLLDAGASDVIAAATHGVLSEGAPARLAASGIRQVVVTDTLPVPAAKRFPQLRVRSVASLLARAIHEVFVDGSVTSLFD
ncbi:ribose-phosphate diphosphokinase [Amycolatopsis sp. A1MSW2902]|uniref:ribose-phosphate diphosphokinase n=1 Tax=Amycolatopsis sp. A1MSW2902 TaxID=687413 RepID=UPI00307F2BB6